VDRAALEMSTIVALALAGPNKEANEPKLLCFRVFLYNILHDNKAASHFIAVEHTTVLSLMNYINSQIQRIEKLSLVTFIDDMHRC
jgi:hypothetical protein